MYDLNLDIERILLTKEQIDEKVRELGQQITEDYREKDLLLVSVLKGSVVFISDIMREINLPYAIDFMAVSSYGNQTKSSGVVKINLDLKKGVAGKDILIIEDIIDSGLTLSYIKDLLTARGPSSVEICSILNKPDCNKVDLHPKYLGFNIPAEFVVGYGLDYAERYRGLPYVGVLKRKVYEKR